MRVMTSVLMSPCVAAKRITAAASIVRNAWTYEGNRDFVIFRKRELALAVERDRSCGEFWAEGHADGH